MKGLYYLTLRITFEAQDRYVYGHGSKWWPEVTMVGNSIAEGRKLVGLISFIHIFRCTLPNYLPSEPPKPSAQHAY